jgi:hypothetical protein
MPEIIATQEAKIRKIMVQGHPREEVRCYLRNT